MKKLSNTEAELKKRSVFRYLTGFWYDMIRYDMIWLIRLWFRPKTLLVVKTVFLWKFSTTYRITMSYRNLKDYMLVKSMEVWQRVSLYYLHVESDQNSLPRCWISIYIHTVSQLTFTCSKLAIETLAKGVKYVQS